MSPKTSPLAPHAGVTEMPPVLDTGFEHTAQASEGEIFSITCSHKGHQLEDNLLLPSPAAVL